jgi:hypothetical protein
MHTMEEDEYEQQGSRRTVGKPSSMGGKSQMSPGKLVREIKKNCKDITTSFNLNEKLIIYLHLTK